MSKLLTLYSKYGQSVWLDFIKRDLIEEGILQDLVTAGIRGVTTNPSIFRQAISGSDAYNDAIRDLIQADPEIDAQALYHWLIIEDVQAAADVLASVYASSHGVDGYISVEISPHLAYDTAGTIEAAQHLWRQVDRPNILIKIPATLEGLPALERLIAEGINVNVTLLFSISRYHQVVDAYLRGLDMSIDPSTTTSVASFFVSRVDSKVDVRLQKIDSPEARALKGRVAIANAKLAYCTFKDYFQSQTFQPYKERGAKVQRLLWASTGTKQPSYSDVLYVDNLIGPETVNTLPLDSLDAFQHHGETSHSLESNIDRAKSDLKALQGFGIELGQITDELEQEGIAKFTEDYDALLMMLGDKRSQIAKDFVA